MNIGIGDAAGNILGEYQIGLSVLFQKRYGSMVNSKKWPNGAQISASNPDFSALFVY